MATLQFSAPQAQSLPQVSLPERDEPKDHAPNKQKAQSRLQRIVLAEGLIGSFLILGAPFLGEHFEQYGGSKTIAIIFAVFHYVFHIAGGAILFKTGMDWGKLHQH